MSSIELFSIFNRALRVFLKIASDNLESAYKNANIDALAICAAIGETTDEFACLRRWRVIQILVDQNLNVFVCVDI